MPGEPKIITIQPHVQTAVLKLGLEVLALRKFPARAEAISRELERRASVERRAA